MTAQEEQRAIIESLEQRIYAEFQKPAPNHATIKRLTKHKAGIQSIIDQLNAPDTDNSVPAPHRRALPEYDPSQVTEHATTLYKDRERTVRYILKLYKDRDALRRTVQRLADELARRDYTWLVIENRRLTAAVAERDDTLRTITHENEELKITLRRRRYGLSRGGHTERHSR